MYGLWRKIKLTNQKLVFMRILFEADSAVNDIAHWHEAFRKGLRSMFDTRMFGKGYEGYNPALQTYAEIINCVFPDSGVDVLLLDPALLGRRVEDLRLKYAGAADVKVPKAFIITDFWNITEHYPDQLPGWLDKHQIAVVLSQYPGLIERYAQSSIANRFVYLPSCVDPQVFNDWKCDELFDVGFLGVGVTSPNSFYPERFRIHEKLERFARMNNLRYLSAPHPGQTIPSPSHPLVGRNFSMKLNSCRMFIVTGGVYHLPFAKYMEALASHTLLLATEPLWENVIHLKNGLNYVRITEEDVLEKVEYYLRHREEAERIAENGYDTAMRYHTCYTRAYEVNQRLKTQIKKC